MSRDWLAVYVHAQDKAKFRRLSPRGRGALLTVWLLAGTESPEAQWRSRDELEELLILEGFDCDDLAELVDERWLDIEPDGTVLVHDWDEHQLAATKAIGQAFEAARKREWRRHAGQSRSGRPQMRLGGSACGALTAIPAVLLAIRIGREVNRMTAKMRGER